MLMNEFGKRVLIVTCREKMTRSLLSPAKTQRLSEEIRKYKAGMKLEMKRSVTKHDDKVCQACKDIAAEGWITIDQLFLGFSAKPPHHPNCRCTEETKIVNM